MSRTELTREEWLNQAAVEIFVEVFYPAGFAPPPYRLSTGWTGRGKSKTTLGQCWPRSASADGRNEVFVSPIIDDPFEAVDVLTHELVHVVDDCQHKHGKEFKRIATAIGLTGPMKSAHAGPELEKQLRRILGKLPPYPHRRLDFDKRDKQSTRMIRMQCTGWRLRRPHDPELARRGRPGNLPFLPSRDGHRRAGPGSLWHLA